jgi:LysR family nod box-dependent transcriptional activator
MNLAGLDLNLLVALDALLSERSVTRAAQRVGLSQPGMSNALARLRGAFDDPLLVRQGAVLVPTSRAEALAGPVREALALIRGAIDTPADRWCAHSPPRRPGCRSRSCPASPTPGRH